MKIAVIGYSGSGKSTLAQYIAEMYCLPVLHLDTVHWLAGWRERDADSKDRIIRAFLDENTSWVIDGNYSKLYFERRMLEADKIIFMNFNRFSCFFRALKRYFANKGKTRISMTEGCDEKFDVEFVKWILHDGRTHSAKSKYKKVIAQYPEKTIVIKSQRELTKYKNNIDI